MHASTAVLGMHSITKFSVFLCNNFYNNNHIYDYNIKSIEEYFFCRSFEILYSNSLSCFSVFVHVKFLVDPFITAKYIISKIYVD
jgi:hypothetical protein